MTMESRTVLPAPAVSSCQFVIGDLEGSEEEASEGAGFERAARGGSEESGRSCESGYSALGAVMGSNSEVRPRSLAIPGLARVLSSGGDFTAGSLPTQPSSLILPRKRPPLPPPGDAAIPRIKCSSVSVASAPSTPLGAEVWPGDACSISSVDEAEEATDAGLMLLLSPEGYSPTGGNKKRSKSRLSLNLSSGLRDEDGRTPSPTGARSPSIIPKFLRNSFSRLMNRESKKSDGVYTGDGAIAAGLVLASNATTPTPSLPFNKCATLQDLQDSAPSVSSSSFASNNFGHLTGSGANLACSNNSRSSSTSCCSEMASSVVTTEGAVPMSPDTLEYLEESKLNSLPVIPFTFPTAVIAEKLKNKNKAAAQQKQRSKNPSEASSCTSTSSPKTMKRSTEAASSDLDLHYRDHLDFAPSSLEEIVFDAERELRFESEQSRLGGGHQQYQSVRPAAPSRSSNVWRLGADEDDDRLSQFTMGFNEDVTCAEAEAVSERRRRRRQLEDDGYFEMFSAEPAAQQATRQTASAAAVASELASFHVGVGRT